MVVQRSMRVRRGDRELRLLVEPNHPRFMMRFSKRVKSMLTDEQRFDLAEALAPMYNRALERWPDNPIEVPWNGHTFLCSDSPEEHGRMLVRLG